MLRLPTQGMGGIRHVIMAVQKSCVLGEEQFQSLLTAQKCIKSFPFLETRLQSQSSKTVRQDRNTPLEIDTSNQSAMQIGFSKVASAEGPHPSLRNNLKDCIPFCSRTAAEGGGGRCLLVYFPRSWEPGHSSCPAQEVIQPNPSTVSKTVLTCKGS